MNIILFNLHNYPVMELSLKALNYVNYLRWHTRGGWRDENLDPDFWVPEFFPSHQVSPLPSEETNKITYPDNQQLGQKLMLLALWNVDIYLFNIHMDNCSAS